MKAFLFKFRPSSHSSDYTIVAKYRTREEAEKAYRRLKWMLKHEEIDADWSPEDAFYALRDKTVYFSVYSNGRLDPVEDVLSDAEDYDVYINYQELTISVEVPKGLSFEAAMLVLPREEAEMLRMLREHCEEIEIKEEGGRRLFIFKYRGDEIYDEFDDELFLGGISLKLSDRPNWTVNVDE